MKNQLTFVDALERARAQNALLLRALAMCPETEAHVVGESIAVREARSGFWMFSLAPGEGDFARLIERFSHPLGYTFLLNDAACMDEVQSVLPGAWGAEYVQYVIEKPTFADKVYPIVGEGLELCRIGEDWLDYILSVYTSREFAHEDYLRLCLKINPAWGATLNGEKVGFIISHLDGELGTIAVSPHARGHGLGRLLMQAITPDYIKQSPLGAGMVLPDNEFCVRMLRGTNYIAAPKHVMWVYRDREHTVWMPEEHTNGGILS